MDVIFCKVHDVYEWMVERCKRILRCLNVHKETLFTFRKYFPPNKIQCHEKEQYIYIQHTRLWNSTCVTMDFRFEAMSKKQYSNKWFHLVFSLICSWTWTSALRSGNWWPATRSWVRPCLAPAITPGSWSWVWSRLTQLSYAIVKMISKICSAVKNLLKKKRWVEIVLNVFGLWRNHSHRARICWDDILSVCRRELPKRVL